MISGVHLCRGNRRSAWVASGGYEPVAEVLFNEIDVDRFLLEFDDDRSGVILNHFVSCLKNKIVVLGLVSSKTARDGNCGPAQAPDRRGRRAMFRSNNLRYEPQCGFASSVPGNIISEEAQWAKLELIAQGGRGRVGHVGIAFFVHKISPRL